MITLAIIAIWLAANLGFAVVLYLAAHARRKPTAQRPRTEERTTGRLRIVQN